MQKIRFTVQGMLMGMEFDEGVNVEEVVEKMLVSKISFVEEVVGAKVITDNRNFVDEVLETTILDGTLDGRIERHVAYKFTLETEVSKTLKDEDIKKMIFCVSMDLEKELCLAVDAIYVDCELSEDDEDDIEELGIEYDIVGEGMKVISMVVPGQLMGLRFKDGSDIDLEAEKLLAESKDLVEKVAKARVINEVFLDSVSETAISDGTLDGEIERHVRYEYVIDKQVPESLAGTELKKNLAEVMVEVEKALCSKLDAINVDYDEIVEPICGIYR